MLARGINIVIVSYFSKNKLIRLLQSLDSLIIENFQLQVIVVNNSVSENLNDLECIHELIIVNNDENKGFGYACNQASKFFKYSATLLLNPDTLVFKSTLQQSIDFFDREPDVTVLGIKHLDENNNIAYSCSRFPKLYTLIFDIVGLSKLFPKVFTPAFLMRDWNHEESRYVDQVMGAFLLIRQSFVQQFGLMDERFFVFLEDTDLCKKVWDNNGKVFYNADITMIHEGGNSTSGISDKKLCFMLEGKLKYAYKYFSFWQYCILFMFIVFVEPFTRITLSIITNTKDVKNIAKAYLLFFKRHNFK